jgi:sec-independent protein translocase protein TatA
MLVFTNILLFNFLGPEMLVVAIVILVLFGGRKIPELMRGIGQGMKEFKNATKEDNTIEKDDK